MNGPRDDINDMRSKQELDQLARVPNDGTRLDSVDPETSAQVTRFVAELRGFGRVPAPQPSDELAAVLAGAVPIEMARRRRALRLPPRRSMFAVAAAGVAAVTLIGVAAANNRLPEPAQGFVVRVVNDWTPIHISVPQHPTKDHSAPVPSRSAEPVTPKQAEERVAPSQQMTSAAPIAPAPQLGPATPSQGLPAATAPTDQDDPAGDDSTPDDGVAPSPPPTSTDSDDDASSPVDGLDDPGDDDGPDPGDDHGLPAAED